MPTGKPGLHPAAQGGAVLPDEDHTALSWGAVLQPLVPKTTPGKAWGRVQTGPTIRLHAPKSEDVIQVVGKVPHQGNVWKEWGSTHTNSTPLSTSAQTGS